ncbi:MAG: DEAD/DEAH box helicase [Alphaproteobacteria bacterium]
MDNFNTLGLPQSLLSTLAQMKFTVPTPIQAQGIPPALEGRDILGSAQTGTGKTGAFGIPLVAKLLSGPRGSALVMTPTRELAVQVMEQLQLMLGKQSSVKTALLIGGESMPKQLQELRMRPRLLVGTPGRINDHLERGSLMLHDTGFLVLDETDRMLDMGFSAQIEKIMKFLPKQRQTLLFSATLPDDIVKIANKYLTDPVRIAVGGKSQSAEKIKQEILHVGEAEKYDALLAQLQSREGSIIIFVKTKYGTEKMAKRLRKIGHSVDAIHGDLRQNRRDRVIAAFRDCKYRILVATDIAARGLDIPHIEHVINYDLPQCPEDYIHRIGRTARAGAEGSSLCFVTPTDKEKWRAVERLLDPEKASQPRQPQGNSGNDSNRSGRPRRRRNRNNRHRNQTKQAA